MPAQPPPNSPPAVAMLDPLAVAAALPVQAATGSPAPAPSAPEPPPPPAGLPEPWDGESEPRPGISTDSAGVPFDAARHLPRVNRNTRRWMPRPPRGVGKRRASTPPATSPASGESTPAAEVFTAPPPAGPSPWSAEEHAMAAEGGGAIPPAPGSPEALAQAQAAAPAPADAESSPEANAEVACEVLYTTTGLATGVPKEARPSAGEHAAMRKATAAYFSARGWTAVGGWAMLIMVLAYLLRVFQKEGSQAKLAGWWESLTSSGAKAAPPAAPPRPAPASSQTIELPASPSRPVSPPAPAPTDPRENFFTGL